VVIHILPTDVEPVIPSVTPGSRCVHWVTKEAVRSIFARRAVFSLGDNQLGRRNLAPAKAKYLRGLQFRSQKGSRGKNHQNEVSTSETLAKKHGVSKATIERDAKFSEAVDEIEKNVPGAKRDALSGKLTRAKVKEVAALPPEQQAEALEGKEANEKRLCPRERGVRAVSCCIAGVDGNRTHQAPFQRLHWV